MGYTQALICLWLNSAGADYWYWGIGIICLSDLVLGDPGNVNAGYGI